MNQSNNIGIPKALAKLQAKCAEIGFNMPSDLYIGTLLKTLITSKPKSRILELGTGIGLSLCWMIDGLDEESQLITLDNDPKLIKIAQGFFGADQRVDIVCADGTQWIKDYQGEDFDLIFADAWPGKYSETEETLNLVRPGGFYVVDDMSTQPNWPDGHQDHVDNLVHYLEGRSDFSMTKMEWSTGIVLMTRKASV